jgi:hypothetical protein
VNISQNGEKSDDFKKFTKIAQEISPKLWHTFVIFKKVPKVN